MPKPYRREPITLQHYHREAQTWVQLKDHAGMDYAFDNRAAAETAAGLISTSAHSVRVFPRPIHVLAGLIRKSWPAPYFGAVPYLQAMSRLSDGSDRFGQEDGEEIVMRFLANASSYRGKPFGEGPEREDPFEIRNELKRIIGIKPTVKKEKKS